jgi:2-aminobenzoate-CoA ligase
LRFGAAAATVGPRRQCCRRDPEAWRSPRHPTAYKAISQPGSTPLKTCAAFRRASARSDLARVASDGIAIVDGISSTSSTSISAAAGDGRPGSTGRPLTQLWLDPAQPGFAEGSAASRSRARLVAASSLRASAPMVGGWNVTGDTYRRDAGGYFWYLARATT